MVSFGTTAIPRRRDCRWRLPGPSPSALSVGPQGARSYEPRHLVLRRPPRRREHVPSSRVVRLRTFHRGTVKLSSKGMEKRRSSLELQTYAAALAPVISAQIANAYARTAR